MRNDVVTYFGGKSKLASALGVERSAVSQWFRRNTVPALRAIQIESLSFGEFKAINIIANWNS